MKVRRDFLKTASLLPLAALSQAQAEKPQDPDLSAPFAPEPVKVSQEQETKDFTDRYHLRGTPATDYGNLLNNAVRPADWKTAKVQLKAALEKATRGDDPIRVWLDTFTPTFDDRATQILLNATTAVTRPGKATELRYEPELYDGTLRSASNLLDRCLRYRNEMGSYEGGGISAGLAYLAFIKTKPIQHNLILQSSTADLTEIERATETKTSTIYSKARGFQHWIEKSRLQGLQVEASGGASEASLASAKDRLRTRLMEEQFDLQADAQLAQFTRLLSSGSSSNYAERYLRILALLTDDLTDAYCKLYSAAKGVQQLLNLTQVNIGTNPPFKVDIPTFSAANDIATWIQAIIPAPGPNRQPDVLDALVLWTRAVARELDRRSQYETEFTVAIPLCQPAGKKTSPLASPSDVSTKMFAAGGLSFTIDADCLPFVAPPTSLRVAAIGLSVEYSKDDFSPLQYMQTFPNFQPPAPVGIGVTPPKSTEPTSGEYGLAQSTEQKKIARLNATVLSPPQQYPVSSTATQTYQRPPVFLTNVRMQGGSGGDLEPLLSFDPAAHNLSPLGTWTISMDPNTIVFFPTGQIPANWIQGVIFHLRLRGSTA